MARQYVLSAATRAVLKERQRDKRRRERESKAKAPPSKPTLIGGFVDLSTFRGVRHPYISMAEGAAIMCAVNHSDGWTSQRFLRFLRSRGPDSLIEIQRPGAKKPRYYVTRETLREAFAEVWDPLILDRAEASESDEGWDD